MVCFRSNQEGDTILRSALRSVPCSESQAWHTFMAEQCFYARRSMLGVGQGAAAAAQSVIVDNRCCEFVLSQGLLRQVLFI